jgi:transcriptional regulator with XRE-family HTH domain
LQDVTVLAAETIMKKKKEPRSPTNLDAIIGQKLKMARQLRDMSREELAERLGVTFQQIQKYEMAKNRVAASRLYAIAEVLELPMAYFFGDKDIVSRDLDLALDKDSVAILREFQPLSKQKRRVVRDLLAQLAA